MALEDIVQEQPIRNLINQLEKISLEAVFYYLKLYKEGTVKSNAVTLGSSFMWSATPQGYNYWSNISKLYWKGR